MDRQAAKELRKAMTQEIMGSNAKSMELVNEMPITEDMLIMIGGTSISEE